MQTIVIDEYKKPFSELMERAGAIIDVSQHQQIRYADQETLLFYRGFYQAMREFEKHNKIKKYFSSIIKEWTKFLEKPHNIENQSKYVFDTDILWHNPNVLEDGIRLYKGFLQHIQDNYCNFNILAFINNHPTYTFGPLPFGGIIAPSNVEGIVAFQYKKFGEVDHYPNSMYLSDLVADHIDDDLTSKKSVLVLTDPIVSTTPVKETLTALRKANASVIGLAALVFHKRSEESLIPEGYKDNFPIFTLYREPPE